MRICPTIGWFTKILLSIEKTESKSTLYLWLVTPFDYSSVRYHYHRYHIERNVIQKHHASLFSMKNIACNTSRPIMSLQNFCCLFKWGAVTSLSYVMRNPLESSFVSEANRGQSFVGLPSPLVDYSPFSPSSGQQEKLASTIAVYEQLKMKGTD